MWIYTYTKLHTNTTISKSYIVLSFIENAVHRDQSTLFAYSKHITSSTLDSGMYI